MPSETHPPAIGIRGCRQHNLKNLDFDIPLGKLTVVTGPSGSGKSSLAFHTLYAEGQRRYVETFSPYVRQFFDRMDKPDVDSIDGIPPAIAIEQKNHVRTSRSTVGTLTEIDDYLKLLYPRLATAFDPDTGEEIRPDSPESAASWAMENFLGNPILITFPIPVSPGTKPEDIFPFLNQQGYLRVLIAGAVHRTDDPPPAAKLHGAVSVIQDRITLTKNTFPRLLEALEAAFRLGKGASSIHHPSSATSRTFSTSWSNPHTGFTLRAPTPSLFSFNNPLGACPKCRGFGRVIGIDLSKAVPDPSLSIARGAIKPFQGERGGECQRDLLRCMKERGIDPKTPFEDHDEATREWIYYGDSKKSGTTPEELEALWQSGAWYGVTGFFDWLETKAYKMHVRVFLSRFRSYTTCPACRGKRLQPEALCFKIQSKTLPELWAMPVADLLDWFSSLNGTTSRRLTDPTLDLVLTNIHSRLTYLCQVGLGYLTLDRTTRTLSGGEIERVNLTTCLGASLTNTLFVLDEPTVGLHARDIDRLIRIMHHLRDKGNTLVVVEHEEAVMRAADQLLDIGPNSGHLGGQIVHQGTLEHLGEFKKKSGPPSPENPDSSRPGTIPWLIGAKSIPVPAKRRSSTASITLHGITRHNLKKLDLDLPLGIFTCLTGVSGSGKSTLAHDGIYLNLARHFGIETEEDPAPLKKLTIPPTLTGIELVDQSPLARTPRSTPAVYLGAFNEIRQLFAQTDAARAADHNTGFFSFNSGNGRCDRCGGNGFEKVEMQFLSDVYVTCPACEGRRYKPSTLEVLYHGKSIADILDLTTDEAISFYSEEIETLTPPTRKRHTTIIHTLAPLSEVGLGHVKLGQPLNTLSGGESQRLKLCQLLANAAPPPSPTTRRSTAQPKRTGKLLILDEPTTGLHFTDIERLLHVFHRLADAGHTLLVIEHNYEVIKSADWIIDLGPDAGKNGGQIVGQGTPEHIATLKTETARFLHPHLTTPSPGTRRKPTPRPSSKSSTHPDFPGTSAISLAGARHHNLKNISLEIPRDQFVVVSGLSGSGKSTLAFDILFAEGQRRFLDSMSAYARQFAEQLEKPEIDQLLGLPPTVAIEQRISQGGVKSTVATVTELWNFIRLLFSKLGTLHCPDCQIPVEQQSIAAIEKTILHHLKAGPIKLLAPLIRGKKGFHTEIAAWALKHGYTTLLVDGSFRETASFTRLERFKEHDIDAVITDTSRSTPGKNAKSSPPASHRAIITSLLPTALALGKGFIKLHTAAGQIIPLSTHCACPSCDRSFEPLDPRLFSFNSPHGWCPECRGHGRIPKRKRHLDLSRYDSVLQAEIEEDRNIARMDDDELILCPACHGSRLNPVASAVRLHGSAGAPPAPSRRAVKTPALPSISTSQLSTLTISSAADFFSTLTFTEKREALIARDILPEIKQRLTFLSEVGLGYLQLDRSGNTLSGGESQRIRLAAQLGSNLRGVLYVLDEPTIGLHPRDNAALLKTLTGLRDHGNSLIIVEHDEDTIAAADHLIDLGPAAGRLGGQIVYQGKPPGLPSPPPAKPTKRAKPSSQKTVDCPQSTSSPTLRAFAHPLIHPTRGTRRPISKDHPFLTIEGCRANNLKDITAAIPLGRLTVFTGISGSGKSTLMHQCIAVAAASERRSSPKNKPFTKATGEKSIKSVYEVDQSPIGKTSRSCPATYVKVFDHIRALFAQMPEARIRGYDASRFSFNTESGRCPDCGGNGRVKLEMDFLPPTWVHCETCDGARYNPATLDVTFREKSIADVLSMTIGEAATFFESQPRIAAPLQLMADTGLGYLQLGQPSPTLSGGESQRIKLVSELIKGRSLKSKLSGKASANLYLIEEPTVGLHLEDIKRLIDILHRLVEEGHTVVVIEHHMAVAAEADWILDLGPEAGERGGTIVAQGTPEQVARSRASRTAPFLREILGSRKPPTI